MIDRPPAPKGIAGTTKVEQASSVIQRVLPCSCRPGCAGSARKAAAVTSFTSSAGTSPCPGRSGTCRVKRGVPHLIANGVRPETENKVRLTREEDAGTKRSMRLPAGQQSAPVVPARLRQGLATEPGHSADSVSGFAGCSLV